MNDYEKKHQETMSRLSKQHDGYLKKKTDLLKKVEELDKLIEASESQMKSLEKMYSTIKKKLEEVDLKWNEYIGVLPKIPKKKRKENDSRSENSLISESLNQFGEGDSVYGD